MKHALIAGLAAGAALTIGGALGAVGPERDIAHPSFDAQAAIMNPMVAGTAMLPGSDLMEDIAISPEHGALARAMQRSGIADALKAKGQFTVFAPTDNALAAVKLGEDKALLARQMGYLVVPGAYDSQALLRAIGEGGGQARLRSLEGGMVTARMNGPTNIVLMDEKGATADIVVYDVHGRNGVLHVIDHMLAPGAPAREVATN